MSAFPALGFDPAPGDVAEVSRLSRDTARAAAELDALSRQLRQVAGLDGSWSGAAADAFSTGLAELPRQLDRAHGAFADVARELTAWASLLGDLQSQARAAEHDAADALVRLRAAQSAAASLPTPGEGADLIAHLQAQSAARRAVERAQLELTAVRARGRQVRERAEEGARQAERSVLGAARAAPSAPGLLERVGEALVDVVRDLDGWAAEQVRENAELLAAVTDTVSVVAFAAGFVPGVGTAVMVSLNLAALAGNGALAAYTDQRDLHDVALAGAAVGLAGGAAAAGRAAISARAAETGAPVKKLPSMFTPGLTMGSRELVWRTVQLQSTLAGHAVGVVSTTETARARGWLPARAGAR